MLTFANFRLIFVSSSNEQVLDTYNLRPEDDTPLLYHRITEAFKWAFALRTELGDGAGDPDIAARVEEVECAAATCGK